MSMFDDELGAIAGWMLDEDNEPLLNELIAACQERYLELFPNARYELEAELVSECLEMLADNYPQDEDIKTDIIFSELSRIWEREMKNG